MPWSVFPLRWAGGFRQVHPAALQMQVLDGDATKFPA